jgi:NAD(P)-dependent dehydrogenase (short-subunit alcohol dehydrogenase family)
MTLEQKVVAITGAFKGIGYSTAELFQRKGWRTAVLDCDHEKEHDVQKYLKNSLITVGDISNLNDVKSWYKNIASTWGRLDAVVANAGCLGPGSIEDLTEQSIEAVIKVNLKGTIFTIQQAIPYLKEGGSMVIVSSIGGEMGIAQPLYGCTKAALTSFTKSAARELIKKGIRVNSVSPGATETPMFESAMKGGDATSLAISQSVPIGRIAQPGEIANVIYFLISDLSSYIIGENILVDGGYVNIR